MKGRLLIYPYIENNLIGSPSYSSYAQYQKAVNNFIKWQTTYG